MGLHQAGTGAAQAVSGTSTGVNTVAGTQSGNAAMGLHSAATGGTQVVSGATSGVNTVAGGAANSTMAHAGATGISQVANTAGGNTAAGISSAAAPAHSANISSIAGPIAAERVVEGGIAAGAITAIRRQRQKSDKDNQIALEKEDKLLRSESPQGAELGGNAISELDSKPKEWYPTKSFLLHMFVFILSFFLE
jgi:hypothetical protein